MSEVLQVAHFNAFGSLKCWKATVMQKDAIFILSSYDIRFNIKVGCMIQCLCDYEHETVTCLVLY